MALQAESYKNTPTSTALLAVVVEAQMLAATAAYFSSCFHASDPSLPPRLLKTRQRSILSGEAAAQERG